MCSIVDELASVCCSMLDTNSGFDEVVVLQPYIVFVEMMCVQIYTNLCFMHSSYFCSDSSA